MIELIILDTCLGKIGVAGTISKRAYSQKSNSSTRSPSHTPELVNREEIRIEEHARIRQRFNDTYDRHHEHTNTMNQWQIAHPGQQIPADMVEENNRLNVIRLYASNEWDHEDQGTSSESSSSDDSGAQAVGEPQEEAQLNAPLEDKRGIKRSRESDDDSEPSHKVPKGPENGPGGPGGSSGHGATGGGSNIPVSNSGNVGFVQLCEDIFGSMYYLEYIALVYYSNINIFIFLVLCLKVCFSGPTFYIFSFIIRPYLYYIYMKYIVLPVKTFFYT